MSAPDAVLRQARECRDLHLPESPSSLRVVQITADTNHSHNHIYMESPVWTPDNRRFIYCRFREDASEPVARAAWRQEFWICDLDDGFALRRLTDEPDAVAPAVDPAGEFLYYFITSRDPAARRGIRLMRVNLQTLRREVVMVIDKPLDGFPAPPSRVYALGTIRADGGAVATGVFLGDGERPGVFGVLVCDLGTGRARVIAAEADLTNPHPQYSRSRDPKHVGDLLVQRNRQVVCEPSGRPVSMLPGCTLYVVRDDGRDVRWIPCGSDEIEYCHGHQEWRGEMPTVIVGIDWPTAEGGWKRPLIEATPIPGGPDVVAVPRRMPGADRARNDITRDMVEPFFGHTTFDATGTRFAADWRIPNGPAESTRLFVGSLPDKPHATLSVRPILRPRSTYGFPGQSTHPHPCLSPDGKVLLLNTDYSGRPQIWMADGFARD